MLIELTASELWTVVIGAAVVAALLGTGTRAVRLRQLTARVHATAHTTRTPERARPRVDGPAHAAATRAPSAVPSQQQDVPPATRTAMATGADVWLLGRRYGPFRPEEARRRWGAYQRFLRHAHSRLWFTYRAGAPPPHTHVRAHRTVRRPRPC